MAATSITTPPASLVMGSGSTAVFNVVATGAPTYQWFKDGVALPGATNRTLVVTATAETAGPYSVVVTHALESGTSASATLSLAPTAEISRFISLSILTNISEADPDFTMGTVLVRAIGPGLGVFGVPGTMPDPKPELFSGANVIAASDNWGGDAPLTAAGKAVGAFAIADLQSKDAMILVTLAPGNYTAQVTGSGSGGVALVEVYEVP